MNSQPELTVSMPAYNSAAYIGPAIDSALMQQGLDFELIVVDDGSTDGTGDVAAAVNDSRVRVIRNPSRKGIGFCHNVVVAESRAPYIVHLDSDDLIIRPFAFRKLLDRIQADENLGLVHAHFIGIDKEGRVSLDRCRQIVAFQRRTRYPGRDYRTALLTEGSVMNHLRLFRKSVFDRTGPFNESLRYGEDYEMALRIAEHFRIDVVPEVLIAVRLHESNTTRLRFRSLRYWWQRVVLTGQLSRAGKISYAKNRFGTMSAGLVRELGLLRMQALCSYRVHRFRVRLRRWGFRQSERVYGSLVRFFGWWPLRPWPFDRGSRPVRRGKCAYYLWRHPVPSETFIRREISALAAQGIPLIIVADEPSPNSRGISDGAVSGVGTIYIDDVTPPAAGRYISEAIRRRPIRSLHLSLYVIFHRYGPYKSFQEDLSLIRRFIILSAVLRGNGVTHIHAPWANLNAFVAMLAAELLGISYSVHARAHEIHRRQQAFALREKFSAAAFVVTNSEYNRAFIAPLLNAVERRRIHVMYEGVTPADFVPVPVRALTGGAVSVLCVARLIEKKGLTYLLMACDELRRRGINVCCDIVGGPQRPTYTAYEVELKKLRRMLGLENVVTLSGSEPFSEVMRKYRAADIFVLPCVMAENGGRDITPNALIEAMACGLPVVSTKSGAVPEIVDDGVDGLLVAPGDARAIADAVASLVHDAQLRARLAVNARKKAETKFDMEANISVLAGLLNV